MARVTFRGGALLAPVPPALVSCRGKDGRVNLLTVAWTGILSTVPPKTYISVRPGRFSYPIIAETGEFVIHLCPASLVRAVDFCGMYTGAVKDKLAEAGLHTVPSVSVAAPTVAECPLALECKVTSRVPLGSHEMFIADITAVTADERLLDETGALHLERADLLAYAHGFYYRLGAQVGKFGFSAAKRRQPTRAGDKTDKITAKITQEKRKKAKKPAVHNTADRAEKEREQRN